MGIQPATATGLTGWNLFQNHFARTENCSLRPNRKIPESFLPETMFWHPTAQRGIALDPSAVLTGTVRQTFPVTTNLTFASSLQSVGILLPLTDHRIENPIESYKRRHVASGSTKNRMREPHPVTVFRSYFSHCWLRGSLVGNQRATIVQIF